jgi:hypothetical protein
MTPCLLCLTLLSLLLLLPRPHSNLLPLLLLCRLASAQHCNNSTLEHQKSQQDSQRPQQVVLLLPRAPQPPLAHLLLLLLLGVQVRALAGCCQRLMLLLLLGLGLGLKVKALAGCCQLGRPHRQTQTLPLGCHLQASLLLLHWRCCHRSDSSAPCCLLTQLTCHQQTQLPQQPLLITGSCQRCCWAAAAVKKKAQKGPAVPGRRCCCHCCRTELAVRSGTFRA